MNSEPLYARRLLSAALAAATLGSAPAWGVTLNNPACYANPKATVSYNVYLANNTGGSTLTLDSYTLGSKDGNYYDDPPPASVASSSTGAFCFMDGPPFVGNYIYYNIGPSPTSNGTPAPGPTYSFAVQQWGEAPDTVYLNLRPITASGGTDSSWQTGSSCPNTNVVSPLDTDGQTLICNEDYIVYLVSSTMAGGAQSGQEAAAFLSINDNPAALNQGSQSVSGSAANSEVSQASVQRALASMAAVSAAPAQMADTAAPTQLTSRLHNGQRWTVIRHGDDQRLTGRVSATDGSADRFVSCDYVADDGHADALQRLYTYSCQTAPVCGTSHCYPSPWSAPVTETLPGRLFESRPGHPDAFNQPPQISMVQRLPLHVLDADWSTQVTPDGQTLLLSKTIDDAQWTIAATGDEFNAVITSTRNQSTPPRFASCQARPDANQRFALDCQEALRCKSTPCDAAQWQSFPTITLPDWLVDPSVKVDPSVAKVDDTDGLIRHYYVSIFGRTPDAASVLTWQGFITGAPDSDTLQAVRDMGIAFFNNTEYLGKHTSHVSYVEDLYRALLQRQPEAAELETWRIQLDQGVPRNQVLDAFLHSQEYDDLMSSVLKLSR